MTRARRFFTVLLSAGAVALAAASANAALMRVDFAGQVETAGLNNFGVNPGDAVTGYALYDTINLAGAGDELIGWLPGLQLYIGTQTFGAAQDQEYPAFPQLSFTDGNLNGFDFATDIALPFGVYAQVDLAEEHSTRFELFEYGASVGTGWFDVAGSQPVPEPGTMLLLGSGLFGLAAFGRKRRKGA